MEVINSCIQSQINWTDWIEVDWSLIELKIKLTHNWQLKSTTLLWILASVENSAELKFINKSVFWENLDKQTDTPLNRPWKAIQYILENRDCRIIEHIFWEINWQTIKETNIHLLVTIIILFWMYPIVLYSGLISTFHEPQNALESNLWNICLSPK